MSLCLSLSPPSSILIPIKVKASFISMARQQVCCQMTFPELNMRRQPRLCNNPPYERRGGEERITETEFSPRLPAASSFSTKAALLFPLAYFSPNPAQ